MRTRGAASRNCSAARHRASDAREDTCSALHEEAGSRRGIASHHSLLQANHLDRASIDTN